MPRAAPAFSAPPSLTPPQLPLPVSVARRRRLDCVERRGADGSEAAPLSLFLVCPTIFRHSPRSGWGCNFSPAPARPGPSQGGPQGTWLGSQPQLRLAAAPLQVPGRQGDRETKPRLPGAARAPLARSPTCAYPAHPATCTSHAFSPRCPLSKAPRATSLVHTTRAAPCAQVLSTAPRGLSTCARVSIL